jgi:hypothetical protein
MYLDFQIRTRFGTFSLEARPTPNTSNTPVLNSDRTPLSQEQSLLFRLPVEIRLPIYEHILQAPNQAPAADASPHDWHNLDHKPVSLTILLTCRRALEEAEGIYYSSNCLCLDRPAEFLARTDFRRRSTVKEVTIIAKSGASMLEQVEQLRTLPNLTALYVRRISGVKFQDVSSWAIMTPQLITALREMGSLRTLHIRTPPETGLSEHDLGRNAKLDDTDRRLRDAVERRNSHADTTG